MTRNTPITGKLFFASDYDAIQHIKSRLRYPFAAFAIRAGAIVTVGALVLCWMNPPIGGQLLIPSSTGEGTFVSLALALGGLLAVIGLSMIGLGVYLRYRRRKELLESLRGTRYVQFVFGVLSRRY